MSSSSSIRFHPARPSSSSESTSEQLQQRPPDNRPLLNLKTVLEIFNVDPHLDPGAYTAPPKILHSDWWEPESVEPHGIASNARSNHPQSLPTNERPQLPPIGQLMATAPDNMNLLSQQLAKAHEEILEDPTRGMKRVFEQPAAHTDTQHPRIKAWDMPSIPPQPLSVESARAHNSEARADWEAVSSALDEIPSAASGSTLAQALISKKTRDPQSTFVAVVKEIRSASTQILGPLSTIAASLALRNPRASSIFFALWLTYSNRTLYGSVTPDDVDRALKDPSTGSYAWPAGLDETVKRDCLTNTHSTSNTQKQLTALAKKLCANA